MVSADKRRLLYAVHIARQLLVGQFVFHHHDEGDAVFFLTDVSVDAIPWHDFFGQCFPGDAGIHRGNNLIEVFLVILFQLSYCVPSQLFCFKR